jgi:hypothetical protein
MPVEPEDKVWGLHPDILILLECESKRVKWAFLKILRGKRDWWSVGSRIVHLTLSFGRSREMRPSLRLHGKWWK